MLLRTIIIVAFLFSPIHIFASDSEEWGFGISPGKPIEKLETYRVTSKLPFNMIPVRPPNPLNPFSFYSAMITDNGKVSGVVGTASFKTWNECLSWQFDLDIVLTEEYGDSAQSKKQGKWVQVFTINNGEIRLACQSIKNKTIKSRLILLYVNNNLAINTLTSNPDTTNRAINRLNNDKSLFKK